MVRCGRVGEMGSWEDELDLDLSDIWAAGSKPEQGGTKLGEGGAQEEGGDDLAFPSQAAVPHGSQQHALQEQAETRVLGLEHGVTRLQSENGVTPLLNADVADAPTQVASLTAEPYVSRCGSTVPLPTQSVGSRGGGSKQRLPPLPSFQPVISREGSTVPIVTQNLASRENDPKQRLGSLQAPGLRNPNSREKGSQQPGVDIRRYFTQRGSSSGADEGGARKKPRIPGPVGDLFQKEHCDDGDAVDGDGDGNVFGAREDDFNDRVFRRGAWISALQSLNVDEFDPAKYAILKVTASSIGASRIQQHVPHFVAVIKELTPNVFGDAAVTLKDPTGMVSGMMNHKVFSNTDYARAISPGAVIVLKQVAIFSPSAHYLNITINNVVQVFAANTDLPQGSAPNPQRQQKPLPQQEQPPQPRSQSRSQPQPQPQSSPPQQEQQPPQPRSHLPSQPLPLQPPQPRSQPRQPPSPSPLQQELQPAQPQSQPHPPQSPPQEPTKAPDGIAAAARMASWDLISPSPSPSPSPPREPSPPQEPKAPEGIAAAAKMAGWGDLTDDMEALLNEDVDDFYK